MKKKKKNWIIDVMLMEHKHPRGVRMNKLQRLSSSSFLYLWFTKECVHCLQLYSSIEISFFSVRARLVSTSYDKMCQQRSRWRKFFSIKIDFRCMIRGNRQRTYSLFIVIFLDGKFQCVEIIEVNEWLFARLVSLSSTTFFFLPLSLSA